MTSQTKVDLLDSFNKFTNEIDLYYMDRFRYKNSCAHGRFPTVDISRSKVRLYLRFMPGGFWPESSIVIANIGFDKQRAGRGRELLLKLVMLSDEYGYTSIGIEQTSSGDSIQNFVRKFGFKNHGNDKNWLVSVTELAGILSSLPVATRRRVRVIPVAN